MFLKIKTTFRKLHFTFYKLCSTANSLGFSLTQDNLGQLLTTFETIWDSVGQPWTSRDTPRTTLDNILDYSEHPGTARDNLGQPETTRDNLGQLLKTIDTIQDSLGQPRTT